MEKRPRVPRGRLFTRETKVYGLAGVGAGVGLIGAGLNVGFAGPAGGEAGLLIAGGLFCATFVPPSFP